MNKQTNTCIEQSEQPAADFLSKYGLARQYHLQDHNPILYAKLLKEGELKSHCLEVQAIAEDRLKSMMALLIQVKPPPNRNADGLAWAAHMSMLKRSAEEIIYEELIYE